MKTSCSATDARVKGQDDRILSQCNTQERQGTASQPRETDTDQQLPGEEGLKRNGGFVR